MYAVLKSDLNTLRVELLRCYVTIHTTTGSLPTTRCSTQPHSNVPLILLNPLSLRGRKRTWGESDAVHLRPAEIQLKEQAIGAGSVTLIHVEIYIYICICRWRVLREAERYDCRCVGAEEEHVSLIPTAVESLLMFTIGIVEFHYRTFLCLLFMLPIREWKLITNQPHIDGIS